MQFEIAKTVPDPERVKAVCQGVARVAGVPTTGLLVKVEMYHHGKASGSCWPRACQVFRQGQAVRVDGYIKLRFRDWEQFVRTFAHELYHLQAARMPKEPWGREKRARAFAEKVIAKVLA